MADVKISDLPSLLTPAGVDYIEVETAGGVSNKVPLTNLPYAFSNTQKPDKVINGGFDLAQRQDPLTLTTYSNLTGRSYGADRWAVTNENASVQYIRKDTGNTPETGLGARYYGKYVKITNAGKFCISQVIEARDMMDLRGQVVRLQVKMKYSVAASMRVCFGILQLNNSGTIDTIPATFISAFNVVGTNPTWGTNLAALNVAAGFEGTGTNSGMVYADITNAWARYSGQWTIPSNSRNLVVVIFTDGQPNALDELNISEVSLKIGNEITAWTPRLLGSEIELAQRFYCKTFPIDTLPAQSGGLNGSLKVPVVIAGAVATSIVGMWRYPMTMRGAPTITFYNPSAANAFVRNVTAATDATATSSADVGDDGLGFLCTGLAAWVVGQKCAVHIAADAEL